MALLSVNMPMHSVRAAAVFCAVWLLPGQVRAAEPGWHSWTTLAEPSKYGDHFTRYSYVDPHARRGGTFNMVAFGSFNSLNPYIVEGQTPAPGLQPFGGGLLYNTLMEQSLDEDSVFYADLACAVQSPEDESWVRFRLDPRARWHDGQPVTVEDVIWSFNVLRKISPYYRVYYRAVERAQASGHNEVMFVFKTRGNRELPKIMGDLVVLPRHWWEGTDKNGRKRDITAPTLEIPLGSGPYRIESFEPGKNIVWKRVEDAWANALPQNIGRYNFDRIKYTYLLDANAEWEAFKKGGLSDFRVENIIQRWMQGYNFSAALKGEVKTASFPDSRGRYQAYFFNTRRARFADVRVRKALTLALDFESINRAIYFGKYNRLTSYYGDQTISARGLPEGREREILETVRAEVPPELFTQPFTLPVYKMQQDSRKYLGEAMELLRQAGWRLKDNRLVDGQGKPFVIEFLFPSPALERATAFYIASLRRLGIDATMRTVDSSQYINRSNNFDFDMIAMPMLQSSSPGNEQADYFGSASAGKPGSRNLAGIRNPAIDKLIDHLVHARTREEVVASSRAIDRVLLWNYYSVPNWSQPQLNIAYWDKFGIPEKQPAYAGVDLYSWWVDPAKQAALERGSRPRF